MVRKHAETIKAVLARLRREHLFVKREKDLFFSDTMDFVGYEVRAGRGATVAADRVAALAAVPAPSNAKEGRRWLGAINYFRRFLEDSSPAIEPLQHAIDTNQFPLKSDVLEAIDKLKQKLLKPPVLAMPKVEAEKMLITDCSGRWAGGV